MEKPQEPKIYSKEEIRKIAPGYRGRPENFDPTKVGKKSAPSKKAKGPASPEVTPPTALDKAAKPTPPKNAPMWADAVFGIDVAVRRLNVNQEITPSFGRLPEIVDDVYSAMSGDDTNIGKQMSKGMLMYYSTAMLWARLLDIKAKRGNTNLSFAELEFCKSVNSGEYNIPQPIYLFIKAVGEVKDASGQHVFLKDHSLPVTVVQGKGGYHSQKIDANTHVLYEEIPSLGICGDVLMAEAAEGTATPHFKVLPAGTKATKALCGYFGDISARKEEIRILLESVGISSTAFDEVVSGTRLNILLVQRVSDYLLGSKTFRNERVKIDALTAEGDQVQLIRSVPTSENVTKAEKWTNLVIRPKSANALPTTTFGASYLTGFQLEKTPIEDDHTNWCPIEKATAASNWTLPATWIANRNSRRTLPTGMDVERFTSVSDSQRHRTNAIVRRMIVSPR